MQMHFLDPYELLQLQVNSPSDVTLVMLTAAQQALDQQIENSPGDTFDIGGKSITKVDAAALAAAMNDADARQQFWEMRQFPELMDYLAGTPTKALQQLILRTQTLGQPLYAFASRWIALQMNRQLTAAVADEKWVEAQNLMRAASHLHPAAEPIAIAATVQFMDARRQEMEALIAESAILSEHGLRKYHIAAMLGVLNALPVREQALQDAYALALGKLAQEAAAKNLEKRWPYPIATAALQIRVTAATKEKLKFVEKCVRNDTGIVAEEQRQHRKSKTAAAIGGFILITAIIFYRVVLPLLLR